MNIQLFDGMVCMFVLAWVVLIVALSTKRSPVVFFHVEKIVVNVPASVASSFLRDVRHLPVYEQKVHSSRLLPRGEVSTSPEEHQRYMLAGGWCGLPWRATFSMRFLSNGGFHSRLVPLSPGCRGVTATLLVGIVGGFALRALPGDAVTAVAHYEKYIWPAWYPALQLPGMPALWARWHRRGMAVEMQALKIAIEAYHRNSSVLPAHLARTLVRSHLNFARFLREVLTGVEYTLPDMPLDQFGLSEIPRNP